MNKLDIAFEAFDSYNKQDPNVFTWEGITYPQEYFLALKLHEWVLKLNPNASEELLLASRSQHIGRWESPRETYPMDREGYLKWRKDLAHFHADKATEIISRAGYSNEVVDRTRQIILKQKIKVDDEVQTMENALCLVFLQFQYEDFLHKHSPEKVVNILRKSLLKMDAHGHQFALGLNYSELGLQYISEALQLLQK
ncbi:MAG: DUF4202 domain-containing protein [Sphingobacteriaceae bacterium]|nr:MAG: DUF4202 domain-containing protein [Sphingobacteriaceae bacterium]